MINYSKVCFVVMPFGIKKIKSRKIRRKIFGLFYMPILGKDEIESTIDFDYIYDNVFLPAIESVPLPEGGNLIAKRTDKDFFSADIGQEMFLYLEYSRIVLTDITGLNANVFYELGIRHHSRPTGTTVFRLLDAPIPFDINHIKAFPYQYDPKERLNESIEMIRSVLTETLKYNRLDSPVQIALKAQQGNPALDILLKDAENAIRNHDVSNATKNYLNALQIDPDNILIKMKIGIIYKNNGEWLKALAQFTEISSIESNYYEAFKEKGIAENKLFCLDSTQYIETGEESLKMAIELNDTDFDAYASLGGILKRKKEYKDALEMYSKSVDISKGNPYPLLNLIKLQAKIENQISIKDPIKMYLERAKIHLENQIRNIPPFNTPWSYFDLAEVCLFLDNDEDNFICYIKEGINYCTAGWQINTFLDSFKLIEEIDNKPVCYADAIDLLLKYEKYLS